MAEQQIKNVQPDYYDTKKKKVIDFCIGFFGVIALVFTGIIGILIGVLIAIILSVIKKRRYIVLGIISGILIPILFVGACMALF